jgi:hypothetical protein
VRSAAKSFEYQRLLERTSFTAMSGWGLEPLVDEARLLLDLFLAAMSRDLPP